MKILLVAQVPPLYELKRSSDQIFPDNQVQTFWYKAIQNLGHDVAVFTYSDPIIGSKKFWAAWSLSIEKYVPRVFRKYRLLRNRYYGYFFDNAIRSKKLVQKIRQYQPSLIIFAGGISELAGTEWQYITNQKIPTILLHGVRPEEGATAYEKHYLVNFSEVITNDQSHSLEWKRLGALTSFALPYSGIDSSVHQDFKLNRTKNVVFVGTLFAQRQRFFEELVSYRSDVELYGYIPKHLKLSEKLKAFYKGEAWGTDVITLLNTTKLAINLVPEHMPTGGNLRTFEIPACGAVQLANRCPKEWFDPDEEVIVFNSAKDLDTKISILLSQPKKMHSIVQKSYKKVHKKYTYEQRFTDILKKYEN